MRVNAGGDDMIMPAVNNQVEPSMRIMAMMARWMTLRLSCLAQMKQRWPIGGAKAYALRGKRESGVPLGYPSARPRSRNVEHVGTPPGSVVR